MSGLAIQIADAVVTELTGKAFSQKFTPARVLFPDFSERELATLQVTVSPFAREDSEPDRATAQQDIEVGIGVQRKVSNVEVEVAALCNLVEEIVEFIRRRPLAAMPAVQCVGVRVTPLYSPEHLHQFRVFTSVITLTYRVQQCS